MNPGKNIFQSIRIVIPVLLISIFIGILAYFITGHYFYRDSERYSLYMRFRFRAKLLNYCKPLNHNIALIAIDKKTLDEDRLPLVFWNRNFVPVIKKLLDNGASVIGFDMRQDLSISDSLSQILDDGYVKNIKEKLISSVGHDVYEKADLEELAGRISGYVPLYNMDKEMALLMLTKKIVLPAHLKNNYELVKPIELITFSAGMENIGVANVGTFSDDIVVSQNLVFDWINTTGSQISALAGGICAISGFEPSIVSVLPSFSRLLTEKFTNQPFTEERHNKIFFRGKNIPLDADGRLWINYRRPLVPEKDTSFVYSFREVLSKAYNNNNEYFERNFKNKIVIIGDTVTDIFRTPFGKQYVPGPEIHMHTISTILDNDYLIMTSHGLNSLIILLLCIITGLITYRSKPFTAIVLCALLAVFYLVLVCVLFIYYSISLNTLSAIFIIPVFGFIYLYKYVTEESEKQKTRKIFGRYVSKNVMEAILSNPKNLALGGERRKITVLFSDINNFTPISEKLKPEELMLYLNNYFNEMNAIIMKYDGTIKQFVGDEIMVMYGTPVTQENQAELAVMTAVEMVRKLEELKKADPTGVAGFYEVKIGIHTGEVVVGNVGSKDRTEYAAVGDNVNMTSRIEGLNKKLGTTILISEDTYEEIKDTLKDIEFIHFEPQEVKGKKNLINVYGVKW